MSHIAIRVENLSKRYRIGSSPAYRTLRDAIGRGIRPLRRSVPTAGDEWIWALNDASFDVHHGDVVGIMGANGAGKSTLLKILSRITEPTSGCVTMYGRVGSLLEVGTGFHQELTGRENIYLSGAILGMKKAEIDGRFDEIVAFSEIDRFIDTPVKHYSSGMQMRLAFAVAAHLEPEILLIDEVLAVGDVSFQKKCLGKMKDVASEGRTVLFVSHNMGAVANLCTSGLWLRAGALVSRGGIQQIIAEYMESVAAHVQPDPSQWAHRGSGDAHVVDARTVDERGEPCTTFAMGATLAVEFEVDFARSFPSPIMSVQVKRADTGLPVLDLLNSDSGAAFENLPAGKHRFRVEVPECALYPGSYLVTLFIVIPGTILDTVQDVLTFSVVNRGWSKRTTSFIPHLGVFHARSVWEKM